MAIHRPASPSLTGDHSRALELFCDRLDARASFARYVNALHSVDRILFFHGDGGNGKSLLLSKLAQDYCRFLPDADRWPDVMDAGRWARLDVQARREVLDALDTALAGDTALPVPHALIDFGGPARWLQDLREPVAALTELRRQLAPHGFKFPLFDYGMLLWLHKNRRLDKGSLQAIFGSTTLDLVTQVLEVVGDATLISAVPKLFNLAANLAFGKRLDADWMRN